MSIVSPAKELALQQKMKELGIAQSDIEESFVRSGAKGGQHVNKTATCVILKHIPTGIVIKCQKTRTQALNRYYARKILVEKLDSLLKGKESKKAQRVEKIKKQKRKRFKRAKEKLLAINQH